MTAKQSKGIYAPDGSLYITLTDGAGNLATVGGSGLTVASTTITSGTTGRVLYDNAGVLGEMTTTGSGTVLALATSPVLVTPALGTPSSGVATNLTGTASGLTAGSVTTNANLTGPITSSGNATAIASQTGTGTKFVVDTSPTLVTPVLGVATITSLTGTSNPLNLFAPTSGEVRLGDSGNGAVLNLSRVSNDVYFPSNASLGLNGGIGGVYSTAVVYAYNATAIPAGGTAGVGYKFSSATNYGIFFGSGAPSLSAAKGSLYLRSDGSGISDRAYINTNGSTTWANLVTGA